MTYGTRLKSLIRELGYTQREFAKAALTSQSAISYTLSGRRGISRATIIYLEEKYNINPKWLKSGKGRKKNKKELCPFCGGSSKANKELFTPSGISVIRAYLKK